MKSVRLCFSGLVALLLLASCGQQLAPTPPDTITAPTTMVESTLTPPASITPLPPPTRRSTAVESATVTPDTTMTMTPVRSTRTPTRKFTRTASPTITPTHTLYVRPPIGGITWTPAPGAEGYACRSITVSPEYGTTFKPRQDFIAKWSVFNIGANLWHVGDVEFGYVSGTRMQNLDRVPTFLSVTVYRNDKINLQVHMVPPKEPGTYTAIWGLRKSNKKAPFCLLDVTIIVVGK